MFVRVGSVGEKERCVFVRVCAEEEEEERGRGRTLELRPRNSSSLRSSGTTILGIFVAGGIPDPCK